jgi:hypothetical protein
VSARPSYDRNTPNARGAAQIAGITVLSDPAPMPDRPGRDGLGPVRNAQAASVSNMLMQFEYAYATFDMQEHHVDESVALMNQWGAQGWDMAAVVPSASYLQIVFKRPNPASLPGRPPS